MNSVLLAVALAAVPVVLPQEWGRLRVESVTQDERGHFLELEYLDDTQAGIESVYVECWTISPRGEPLHTVRKRLNAPGATVVKLKVYVRDRGARAERVECQLAMGKLNRSTN